MRFMVIVKASKDSEAGQMPSEQLIAEMGKYNEELVKAGIMLAGEGLQASSKGARVYFSKNKRTVTDGPFAETKELIAGFWIWKCKSLKEAIDWAKRCPNPTGDEGQLEIRQVMEMEDFGDISPGSSKRKRRLTRRQKNWPRRPQNGKFHEPHSPFFLQGERHGNHSLSQLQRPRR